MALALFSNAVALRKALVLCVAALLGSAALTIATNVHAQVFYSKQEALEIAFPDVDRVETESFFLTQEEVVHLQSVARAPIDSKLVTFYVGYIGDVIQGYAFIESHIVRTFAETFLIVVSPDGVLETLVVLAFYEPPDYIPSDRWLQQFDQKKTHPLPPITPRYRQHYGLYPDCPGGDARRTKSPGSSPILNSGETLACALLLLASGQKIGCSNSSS